MEYEKIVKKHRKKMIIDLDAASITKVDYKQKDIEKLIPHRDPFLLVDQITGIDFEQEAIYWQ